MRHLDDAARRRLLAARQLPRREQRATAGIDDVTAALGPLHATDPSTAYLQLAARTEVSAADVDAALYVDRTLLRHTTLRRTVFLLPLDLVGPAHGAYNHRLVPRLRRQLLGWLEVSEEVAGDAGAWLDALCDEVCAAVAALEAPSGAELGEAVAGLQVTYDPAPGKPYSRPGRITSRVLELLIAEGRIARGRPRGTDWTSGAWSYAPLSDWVEGGIPALEPPDALAALLGHHLWAFAGSSVEDLAWWTGLPKGMTRVALAALGTVEVARDDGATGHVLPDDTLPELTDAGAEDAPRPALLPSLDATPMGWQQRDWFLGPHAAPLFDRTGNVGPTAWWRGRVVGGWTQRADGEVVLGLLEDVGDDARTALEAEAARLAAWCGDVRVRWRFPTPLQRELDG